MNRPTDQMKAILEAHAAMHPPPIETLSAELARQVPLVDRAAVAVYGQHFTKRASLRCRFPWATLEHLTIAGPEGDDMLLRIYTPRGATPEEGWPILLSSTEAASVNHHAQPPPYPSCRALCEAAQCVVVSLHYRQAPEHPWPAAPEDALAASASGSARTRAASGAARGASRSGARARVATSPRLWRSWRANNSCPCRCTSCWSTRSQTSTRGPRARRLPST